MGLDGEGRREATIKAGCRRRRHPQVLEGCSGRTLTQVAKGRNDGGSWEACGVDGHLASRAECGRAARLLDVSEERILVLDGRHLLDLHLGERLNPRVCPGIGKVRCGRKIL